MVCDRRADLEEDRRRLGACWRQQDNKDARIAKSLLQALFPLIVSSDLVEV
jgi:hypothetical protein